MDFYVTFSHAELKQLYDKFVKYDKNRDNVLSRSELLQLVQEGIENASHNEVDWFLSMIDINVQDRDAVKVNFPQYVRGMSEFAKVGTKLVFKSKGDGLADSLVKSAILSGMNLGFGSRRGLDWKEVNRIYQQFMNADTNKSGTISYSEMEPVFKKVVPSLPPNQYSIEFNKIDKNGSGYVDFMEFVEWAEQQSGGISLGRTKSPSITRENSDRSLKKQNSQANLQTVKLRSRRQSLVQAVQPISVPRELSADAFKAFAAMDDNADGELSEEEFNQALDKTVNSPIDCAEKRRLYGLVDSDTSNSISFEEFLYAVAHHAEVSKVASKLKHSYFASKFPWEIPHDELNVEVKVGEGNFGVVSKGKWHGTPVAIKKLKPQAVTEELMEDFKKELTVLAKLRHPNVVLFIGASTMPENAYIVTEYLPEGTVYNILHKIKPQKKFSHAGAVLIGLQVARGMAYLHANNVIHRDLKTPNLLMDDNYVCKLVDFGLSCLLPKGTKLKDQVGSPLWMAPEVLRDDEYTEKIDQYSFAICLWEVVTNALPYEDFTLRQLANKVNAGHRPEIPETVDSRMADLIRQCWHGDPTMRPTFVEIVGILEKMK